MPEGTDPASLCPYCDRLLPEDPSQFLLDLLEKAYLKSVKDPRPSNPSGRKAPISVYVDLCSRHQFEGVYLPQAKRKGWPTSIDWESVEKRIIGMAPQLKTILANTGPARANSIFWFRALENKRASIQQQMNSLPSFQLGYYGELGAAVIHRTLTGIFDEKMLVRCPGDLEPGEFWWKVLMPEAALRLIMEDFACGKEDAELIRRESCHYGVSMFPVTD
ncbi:hypothetical protein B0H14DRAFT_2928968 [Mycena olivaceomarginata]|nr:hypothetical protein B0H14DRAFT_2928968 [Mycena olivaceomarginata]